MNHFRDKLNNLVLFDKGTYDKLYKEVPTYKLITPSIVSERLKVGGPLDYKSLLHIVMSTLPTLYDPKLISKLTNYLKIMWSH